MSFEIDRADMKLLTEAGYSGLMRGIDSPHTQIFDSLNIWMPQYAAGSVGLALHAMINGEYTKAEEQLNNVLGSDLEGKDEAKAVLAMCKILQQEQAEAEKIAAELEETDGYAKEFTQVMVHGVSEDSQTVGSESSDVEPIPQST